MNESTTPLIKQFTGCATLAAIGIKLRELKVFQPIQQTVQIAQKTIKDSPTDKLYDAFISLLAGAQGLVEINTRLRADGDRRTSRRRSWPGVWLAGPNSLCREPGSREKASN